MKKRIFFTLLMVGILSVSSLKAQFSIGPGINYATKIEQLGLTANVAYDINEMFGLMADYNYFFKKNSLEWWALDFDGTYNFYEMGDKSRLYALAGLNLLYYKFPHVEGYATSSSLSYTGLNIGAGWKLGISDKMNLVPEVRYTLGNANYLRIGVKLMFGL